MLVEKTIIPPSSVTDMDAKMIPYFLADTFRKDTLPIQKKIHQAPIKEIFMFFFSTLKSNRIFLTLPPTALWERQKETL